MTAPTVEMVPREQYDAIYARWSALTTLATERLLALNEAKEERDAHARVIERVRVWGKEFDNPDAEPYSFADEMLTVISSLFAILDAAPPVPLDLAEQAVLEVHHHDIEAHAASFNEGWDEAVKQGLAEPRGEVVKARQILADAPHGPHCSSLIAVPDPPRYGCDCWKAGL